MCYISHPRSRPSKSRQDLTRGGVTQNLDVGQTTIQHRQLILEAFLARFVVLGTAAVVSERATTNIAVGIKRNERAEREIGRGGDDTAIAHVFESSSGGFGVTSIIF
jgi:hypothetical protein